MVQEILLGTLQEPIAAGSNNDHAPQEDYEDCDDCNNEEQQINWRFLVSFEIDFHYVLNISHFYLILVLNMLRFK